MKPILKQKGFTIVELLIVIVVIGILAAITIVAYNGIQARAQHANTVSDIKSMQKILEIYKADKGSYPSTGAAAPWNYSSNNPAYIPDVVPSFTNQLPQVRNGTLSTSNCYIYRSDGTHYKLLRLKQPSFSAQEQALVPNDMKDGTWASWQDRYGVWSEGSTL